VTARPWRRRRQPLLCRWDLDKTYLRSEFDTLRQLWRTAWERGADKIEVPGGPAVVKALHAASTRRQRRCGIYFVSASPPQIGAAIREKLALDGVPYDDIVFKDQLRHLRRGRLRILREHVGFKLLELLAGRAAAEAPPEELLFGDDWESDPLTYSIYADVVDGHLAVDDLAHLLDRVGVDHEAVPGILARARTSVPAPGAVRRIFINLARRTPPGRLRVYGPRLVPTYNYFQTAVVLAADGFVDANDVAAVAESLAERAGFRDTAFENSLADLVRRGIVAPRQARRLTRSLVAMQILPRRTGRVALLAWWRAWRRTLLEHPAPPPSVGLDYDAVLAAFPHLEQGASAHKE
jgi:hypothetical protein